jgi:hypothetical protein
MGVFATWRRNRVAKVYARKLGPWLCQHFGSGGSYTPQQIKRGVDELNLNSRYIVLAYGRFLDEGKFEALLDSVPVKMAYIDARDLMDRFAPLSVKFDSKPDANYRAYQGDPPQGY